MSRPRLIVNGDDFGLSEEVNQAIILAFRNGILTTSSLMVAGPGFDHAVKLAKENRDLPVGIHLVTVFGRSVLPPRKIPALVDAHGDFLTDPTRAGLKYFFCRAARRQLKDELRAQFEKFLSTGLNLSHVDGHLHMHVHPVVFDAAVELAQEYGVRRMRLPDDDLRVVSEFDGRGAPGRAIHAFVFRMLCNRMRRILNRRGFVFAEKVFGNFMSGKMSEKYVIHVLRHMDSATNEIYFHPALCRPGQTCSSLEEQCGKEYGILVSERVMDTIRTNGIVLINYGGLESS